MADALGAAWQAFVNWPYLVPMVSLVTGLGVLNAVIKQQKAKRTLAGLTFYRDKNPFRFWLNQITFGFMAAFLVIIGIVGFAKLLLAK